MPMPSWSSITNRIGNVFGGFGEGLGDAAVLVYETVTLPLAALVGAEGPADRRGDVDLSTWEVLEQQWQERGLGAIGQIFGPDRGLGAAIGGLPEEFRSFAGGVIQPVAEGIETVGREGIREPIAAALLAGSLAEGGRGFGDLDETFRQFFTFDTWRRAKWLVDDVNPDAMSPGQGILLALATRDITNPEEIRETVGSEWWGFTSGTIDATLQIFGDPTFIGGKVAKGVTVGALAGDARLASRAYGRLEDLMNRQGVAGRVTAAMVDNSSNSRWGIVNRVNKTAHRWNNSDLQIARHTDRLTTVARLRREGYFNGGWAGKADGPVTADLVEELAGKSRREIIERTRGLNPKSWKAHHAAIGVIESEVLTDLHAEMQGRFASQAAELDQVHGSIAENIAREADTFNVERMALRKKIDDLVASADPSDEIAMADIAAARTQLDDLRSGAERRARELERDIVKVDNAREMNRAFGQIRPEDARQYVTEAAETLEKITGQVVEVRSGIDVLDRMVRDADDLRASLVDTLADARKERDLAARQHRRATRLAGRRARRANRDADVAADMMPDALRTVDRVVGEVLGPLAVAATRDWIGFMETVGREARRPSNLARSVDQIGAEFMSALEELEANVRSVSAAGKTTTAVASVEPVVLADAVADVAANRVEITKAIREAERLIRFGEPDVAEAAGRVLEQAVDARDRLDDVLAVMRDARDQHRTAAKALSASSGRRVRQAEGDEERALGQLGTMAEGMQEARIEGPIVLGRDITDLPTAVGALDSQIAELEQFLRAAPKMRRAAKSSQTARAFDPDLPEHPMERLVGGIDEMMDAAKARRDRLTLLRDEARRISLDPERLTTRVWEAIQKELEEVRTAEKTLRDNAKAGRTAAALTTAATGSDLLTMKQMVKEIRDGRAYLAEFSRDRRRELALKRQELLQLEREGDELHSRIQKVQETLDTMHEEKVGRMAVRVADLLFPNYDPHRLVKGFMLARASSENREQVMRFMMGDPEAVPTLLARRQALLDSFAAVKARPQIMRGASARRTILETVRREGPLPELGPAPPGATPAIRHWIEERLGDEYALRMESPAIASLDVVRLDELDALIDSMQQVRADMGAVEVLSGSPAADAMARWEAFNGLDTIEQVDGALRFAEREAGLWRTLDRTESAVPGRPALRIGRAAREGIVDGKTGQRTQLFYAAGSRRQRLVYDAARVAAEWAYPDNPSVARRIASTVIPVRGALTLAEYATARRPPARIVLDDVHAERHVISMLRASGMDETDVSRIVSEFTVSSGQTRAQVFNEARESAIGKVLDDAGLTDPELRAVFNRQILENEAKILGPDNVYGVHKSLDDNGDVLIETVDKPYLKTQAATYGHVVDLHQLARQARRFAKAVAKGTDEDVALRKLRYAEMATMPLDEFQRLWKYDTLLRPAWATRVVIGDEIWRKAFIAGSFVKTIANVIAKSPLVVGAVLSRQARGIEEMFGMSAKNANRMLTGMGAASGALVAGPAGAAIGAAATRGLSKLGRNVEMFDSTPYRLPSGIVIPSALDHTQQGRLMADAASAGEQMAEFTTEGNRPLWTQRGSGAASPVHPQPSGKGAPGQVRRLEAKKHLAAWADLLNRQFSEDPAMQQLIRFHRADPNTAVGKFNRWLTRTADGRQYLHDTGLHKRDLESFAAERLDTMVQMLDEYVGFKGGHDDVLDAILDGTVTPKLLETNWPNVEDRPVIHAQLADQTLTGGWKQFTGQLVETMMDTFAVIPTDMLVRMPMFRDLYTREMARRLMVKGYKAGDTIPEADMARMVRGAREWALSMTRHYAYDAADSTRLHHLLRFAIPFAPAQQEVVQRWLGFAVTDPDKVALMYAAWDALSDQAEERIPGEPDAGKVFRVSVPSWIDPRTLITALGGEGFETTGDWTVPANAFSMNPVTGGVESVTNMGLGPVLAVPIAQVVRDRPVLQENEFLKMFFPYGVPDGVVDGIIPGWQKQFAPQILDPDRYARTFNNILQTRFVWAQLGDPRQPDVDWGDPNAVADFIEDVHKEAEAFHISTGIFNSAMPFSLTFDSMFAVYKNEWARLRELHAGDPSAAEAAFYDQYGAEMMALTESFVDSNRGIPPTIAGYETYQRFQPFIDANPLIASAFLAQDETLDLPDLQYSGAVRDHLMRQIDQSTGEPYFELSTPQEFIADVQTATGWIQFNRLNQQIDAELEKRGISSIRSAAAANIADYRTAAVNLLAEQNPQWADEYFTTDLARATERRFQFREWVERADEFDMDGRPDVQAIGRYLTFRDGIVSVLRERVAAGGSISLGAEANRDLREAVEEMLLGARAESIAFEAVFNRWFERDVDQIKATDEIFGEDLTVADVVQGEPSTAGVSGG